MTGAARVFRTRRAREDLVEIWRYVARDNPLAADDLLGRIDESCRLLADNPELGPARPDIRPGLRYFVVERYVVLYRAIEGGVEVVRVVHGARDLFNLA